MVCKILVSISMLMTRLSISDDAVFPICCETVKFFSLPLVLFCIALPNLNWSGLTWFNACHFQMVTSCHSFPLKSQLPRGLKLDRSSFSDTLVFLQLCIILHIENLLFTYTSHILYVGITVY